MEKRQLVSYFTISFSHSQHPVGFGLPTSEIGEMAENFKNVHHSRACNIETQEGERQIKIYLGHYFTFQADSVQWTDKK